MSLFTKSTQGLKSILSNDSVSRAGDAAIHRALAKNGMRTADDALSSSIGAVSGLAAAGATIGASMSGITGQDTFDSALSGAKTGALIGGIFGAAGLAVGVRRGKIVGSEAGEAIRAGARPSDLRKISTLGGLVSDRKMSNLHMQDMRMGNPYFSGRFSNTSSGVRRYFSDGNIDAKFSGGTRSEKSAYTKARKSSINQEAFLKQQQQIRSQKFNDSLTSGSNSVFSAMRAVKNKLES